jgi:hypothetical protein
LACQQRVPKAREVMAKRLSEQFALLHPLLAASRLCRVPVPWTLVPPSSRSCCAPVSPTTVKGAFPDEEASDDMGTRQVCTLCWHDERPRHCWPSCCAFSHCACICGAIRALDGVWPCCCCCSCCCSSNRDLAATNAHLPCPAPDACSLPLLDQSPSRASQRSAAARPAAVANSRHVAAVTSQARSRC